MSTVADDDPATSSSKEAVHDARPAAGRPLAAGGLVHAAHVRVDRLQRVHDRAVVPVRAEDAVDGGEVLQHGVGQWEKKVSDMTASAAKTVGFVGCACAVSRRARALLRPRRRPCARRRLNELFARIQMLRPLPMVKGARLKIKYATQADTYQCASPASQDQEVAEKLRTELAEAKAKISTLEAAEGGPSGAHTGAKNIK